MRNDYNVKSLFVYGIAAFFVANALYFAIKGFFFQQAGFGYVWSMFNYFVAAVSLLFMHAFKQLARQYAEDPASSDFSFIAHKKRR